MSRAFAQGLGFGLMSFGQGLERQMDENARQRREESLLALRREWQQEDRAAQQEFQVSLLDRQDARQDQLRAEDWERGADQREADLARSRAQTERWEADAERLRNAMEQEGPASMDSLRRNPERFVPATVQAALEQQRPELAVPRDQGFRLIEARNRAVMEMINQDTSLMNATPEERQAAFMSLLPAVNEQFFMLYQGVIPEEALAPLLAYERPEQLEEDEPVMDGVGLMDRANGRTTGSDSALSEGAFSLGQTLRQDWDILRNDPKAYATGLLRYFNPFDSQEGFIGQPVAAIGREFGQPLREGFGLGPGSQPSQQSTPNPEATLGSRNNPLPVPTSTPPEPNKFYLHPSGALVQWDEEAREWVER